MVAQLRSRSHGTILAEAAAGAASLALAVSGILHLYQAPMHLDHSWEHAAVLATVGAVDLAWAAVWMRSRSTRLLQAGVFLSVTTVVLYALSRLLPLPFEGRSEEVTALNLGTQLFEVAGLAALAGAAALLHRKARTVALAAAAALPAAGFLYGAALLVASLTT